MSTPKSTAAAERAAFEAWATYNGYSTEKESNAKGLDGQPVYADTRVHAAWWAWCDRVAATTAQAEPAAQPESLAMMIRMMASSLKRHHPESTLPARAMDLLKRYGLQGSVLRNETEAEPAAQEGAQPEPQARQAVALSDEQIDNLRGLDTPQRVRFYEHDFYVLSNFSAFELRFDGNNFATSEHAYHWQKFYVQAKDVAGRYIRDMILDAPSAHEAFKLAERNRHLRRPDWDDVKVGIMRGILRAKAAQHEYVRRKLLDTGDRELVEDSWRDDFWGWGPNRDGQNMLGKLWMEVRAELRAANGLVAPAGSAG
ncbi:MAG: NADAR family protein [Burkholderiaceae bacterium]|nr:NADAR family protein [Burkholderiaceae bacterium]